MTRPSKATPAPLEPANAAMAVGEESGRSVPQLARLLPDLRLLKPIQKRSGRITIRQVTRSRVYPTTAEAEARLEALVRAGLGKWTHARPGPKGGRPARTFVMTAPGDSIARLQRVSQGSAVRGSRVSRQIAREFIAFINRYQRTPCREINKALSQIMRVLANSETSQGEFVLPMGCRLMGINRRGVITVLWKYRGDDPILCQ